MAAALAAPAATRARRSMEGGRYRYKMRDVMLPEELWLTQDHLLWLPEKPVPPFNAAPFVYNRAVHIKCAASAKTPLDDILAGPDGRRF
jgi:hypothetical protein